VETRFITAVTMDGSEDVDQGGTFLSAKDGSLSDIPESHAVFALVANCAHDLKTVSSGPEKWLIKPVCNFSSCFSMNIAAPRRGVQ
jgi:hypothetical protein